jgi:hypothetical protein
MNQAEMRIRLDNCDVYRQCHSQFGEMEGQMSVREILTEMQSEILAICNFARSKPHYIKNGKGNK